MASSFRQDLALAARRTHDLTERFPDERDELVTAWAQMLDDVEAANTAGDAEKVLTHYFDSIERRRPR